MESNASTLFAGAAREVKINGSVSPSVDTEYPEKTVAAPVFEPEYPTGVRLGLLTFALMISVFLVALVRPIFTERGAFHSSMPKGQHDHCYRHPQNYRPLQLSRGCRLVWFGVCRDFFSSFSPDSFSLDISSPPRRSNCSGVDSTHSCQSNGQVFISLNLPSNLRGCFQVYITAISIFELGSLICGVAPTSKALIVGRAIAGVGCAGIFSGALIIVAHSAPLPKRPMFTGLMGTMYGVASVAGPLMGGAFADKVTWRWYVFFLHARRSTYPIL